MFYDDLFLFLFFFFFFFFFFQAEDGIRDDLVTGVQTCALPISPRGSSWSGVPGGPPPAAAVPPRSGSAALGPSAASRRRSLRGRARWRSPSPTPRASPAPRFLPRSASPSCTGIRLYGGSNFGIRHATTSTKTIIPAKSVPSLTFRALVLPC